MVYPEKYPPPVNPQNWNSMVDIISRIGEAEWSAIIDLLAGVTIAGNIAAPYSFLVRKVGAYYEAVSHGGIVFFGGEENAGDPPVSGTDALAVIQASLTNGVKVFVKAGTYNITGNLNLISGNVLEGEGYKTELKATAPGVGIVISDINNVVVRNLRINGNRDVVGGGGINLQVRDDSYNVIVENIWTHDAGADGAGAWCGAHHVIFKNIYAYNCGTNGLFAEDGDTPSNPAHDVIFIGGHITNSGLSGAGDGIRITQVSNITAEGFIIDTSARMGIYTVEVENIVIKGNQVYNSAFTGIQAAGYRVIVEGNVVDTAGQPDYHGITLGGSDNIVSSNTVRNIDGTGIYLDNCDRAIVSSNIVENCTKGIYAFMTAPGWIENVQIVDNIVNSVEVEGILGNWMRNSQLVGNIVSDAQAGIHLIGCDNNTISGCSLFLTQDGITLQDSDWNIITGVNIPDASRYGINAPATSDYNIIIASKYVGATQHIILPGANSKANLCWEGTLWIP